MKRTLILISLIAFSGSVGIASAQESYYDKDKGAAAPNSQPKLKQSVSKGAAEMAGNDLEIGSSQCTLSNGTIGLVVKVKSTGEMRCASLISVTDKVAKN